MSRPLCFVLMPVGNSPDGNGKPVDFDAVYRELFAPAIADAGLEPLRADPRPTAASIHARREMLSLSEYAMVDLSTADTDIFYELGLRHAVRAARTVCPFAEGRGLPFDETVLRAVPYRLDGHGRPSHVAEDRAALTQRLKAALDTPADSPLFQLLEEFPDIQRLKTDLFRDRVRYPAGPRQALARARELGADAVHAVEAGLGDIEAVEAGVVIDLLLSYRAVADWQGMLSLTARMSPVLAATVLVREQLGLALNRLGRSEEAEQVLLRLIRQHGPSSETNSILGRVYKDRWAAARSVDPVSADALLDRAIDTYLQGFEADWRDAYPGINAVTLMELKDPPDERRLELLPVVRYAVRRRIAAGESDYWDHASLVELAVLSMDAEAARSALGDALAAMREPWEGESTARNLRLIRENRAAQGELMASAKDIEQALLDAGPS